uniref:NADH-ubiquinone oxidoreductase chain 3 n=1 Tax=Zele chlorophthalmus TaxID=1080924 RepID=A0A345X0Q2_ZELCH|nr:NADH dehydrogenase subunit 3 [Zele chlorophthalmus]AXK15294.1 NADH dehydrogenase subunit 3 [Zele chlorophthalmus]
MLMIYMMMFMMIILLSMYFMNFLLYKKLYYNRSKMSTFECGFETFESIRLPFSINFYLIAILFLIFDLEIIYLFPMIMLTKMITYKIWFFCSMLILLILYLGLEFEKSEGSLKWFI